MAPIVWFSKRQPTVESSVFGEEFVAMKNGIETCRGLRYKLRIMGVTLSGPTFVYGDNMSVVHNTQRPEYVFRVIIQYVSLLPWESQTLGMCILLTILLIFALRLCQVGRNVIT
jgi:hypothetical protein